MWGNVRTASPSLTWIVSPIASPTYTHTMWLHRGAVKPLTCQESPNGGSPVRIGIASHGRGVWGTENATPSGSRMSDILTSYEGRYLRLLEYSSASTFP